MCLRRFVPRPVRPDRESVKQFWFWSCPCTSALKKICIVGTNRQKRGLPQNRESRAGRSGGEQLAHGCADSAQCSLKLVRINTHSHAQMMFCSQKRSR